MEGMPQALVSKTQALPILTYTDEGVQQKTHSFGGGDREKTTSGELCPENYDIRRQSADPPKRRQLPSTEHLERALSISEAAAAERRRASTMVRTNAMLYPNGPIKQNSSPLPQERRQIYSKDHLYSKSWNPEINYDDRALQHSYMLEPASHYAPKVSMVLYPPPPQLNSERRNSGNHLGVVHRQVRSFDERANERLGWTERRSQSERDQRVLERQRTQHEEALVPQSDIGHQCQTLWEARSHLEQLRRLGIEDPSSASTSFESNTEAIIVSPRNTPLHGRDSVEDRRHRYRSLLHQRRLLPGNNFESIESTVSTESNGVDDRQTSVLMEENSLDSSEAERMYVPSATSTLVPATSQHHQHQQLLQQRPRDYSVDATSDSIFREFVRYDPKYEMAAASATVAAVRRSPLPKWETFDFVGGRVPGQRPMLAGNRQLSHAERRFV